MKPLVTRLPIHTQVDAYFNSKFILPEKDAALKECLRRCAEAGMPSINVAPNQGKMLQILARSAQSKRILEIGTLGGYSTIFLARGLTLPEGAKGGGGGVTTLEISEKHAQVARENLRFAKLDHLVDVRVGPALDSLARLVEEAKKASATTENYSRPFDMVFIDADKTNNANYFNFALQLARKGALIVTDNVVRDGKVVEEGSEDERVVGTRRFFEALAEHERRGVVYSTAVQTVGSKGYDGFAISVVI